MTADADRPVFLDSYPTSYFCPPATRAGPACARAPSSSSLPPSAPPVGFDDKPTQQGIHGYPPVADGFVAHDAWRIKASSAVIDGEIVVPAADGTTDFSVLQNELKGKSTKIVLVAFDLLYLNGRDLRKLPLIQRKGELKKILIGTDVQFSERFEIEGREMFAHACKLGLEGVVSKVRDGSYPKGRTSDWVKKTCIQRETLTIAGFALDEGKWDGIYVGRLKGDDLIYAGKVDHGFDKASAADLQKRLKPLIRKTQPYTKRIAHKGIWVEPKLLAEIEYRAKSAEGKVRHPFFRGLREDL
ncbi:DNA ligase [Bradyrhizobium sp. WSM1253]|uniref:ATP dependent DNA ligase n=1 Tax=Bradyrhizobium sp. WSM1253 TaxID=319003 RepID=UPI00352894FD